MLLHSKLLQGNQRRQRKIVIKDFKNTNTTCANSYTTLFKMTPEKFSLKWNEFQENISTCFGNMRNDTNFSDVTLISEDGQKFEVHKIIISASSPFFMNMLQMNKHPQTMIYLKGFKSSQLTSILDFIYHGVADIYQDDLDHFLALAEELQLKGLTGRSEQTKKQDLMMTTEQDLEQLSSDNSKLHVLKSNIYEQNFKSEYASNGHKNNKNQTSIVIAMESGTQNKVSYEEGSLGDLKSTIWSMISNNGTILVCSVCGKTIDKTVDKVAKQHMENHVESLHLDGVTYECTKCDKTFRSKNNLHKHTFRHHK